MNQPKSTVKNPELVFGLVGPIGVDIEGVTKLLIEALNSVDYTTSVIHLTKILGEIRPSWPIDENSYSNRYKSLIANADNLRKETDNNSVFSALAIGAIRKIRKSLKGSDDPVPSRAYIVRQLKREEEIKLFREIYGRKFVQISIYLDKEARQKILVEKIKEHSSTHIDDHQAQKDAIDLIEIDNNEAASDYGQRVSDAFPLGDVFIEGTSSEKTKADITRFINAFFGHNGISPTKIEYGMYTAAGAALRSLDLSRQVGAAIFSENGEAITLGCNEVPKAFGGTYWCDDPGEKYRDYEKGSDRNHHQKIRVIHDLVERLGKLGYLSDSLIKSGDVQQQVRALLSEQAVADSKAMDLIEFGRMIHAEMSAITDAARLGKALKDSILFCTTFPCHMCAKHIISSGIRKVVFLEPYPKSHAQDFHSDSITFLENEKRSKVLYQPFIGISPRRYRDIFEKKKRKDSNGKAVAWYEGEPAPRIEDRSSAYVENENSALYSIRDIIS